MLKCEIKSKHDTLRAHIKQRMDINKTMVLDDDDSDFQALSDSDDDG
ncbi:hypothetical protein FNYG_03934 [Fusarium nygamai]|uniref:Uncharacterized protein n=1 Tax=Gibberella nygamai TaxID=42673 RepID=A0A2K0WK92_GIBNY|nr:hypothetical protein FNYG_03934 [Fusarium nygamai]